MGDSVPKHAGPISLTDTHPRTEHLPNATDHHRRESQGRKAFFSGDAQAACRCKFCGSKPTLQKLRCRSFDDLDSEIGGFPFEIVAFQLAVLAAAKLRFSGNECDAS